MKQAIRASLRARARVPGFRTPPLTAIRDPAWLDAARARAYAWLLAIFLGLLTAGAYAYILWPALSDPHGRPLASDFDTFWAGAILAVHGRAAAAYDAGAIKAAESVGAQLRDGAWFVYLYPPMFQLLAWPLGLVPYVLALGGFLAASLAALAACMRAILPRNWPMLGLAAFPPVMLNLVIGQNGCATAACFGAAMVWLERRPALAGAALGLLAAKPHLALCVPVGLLAARRWRALCSCAAMAAGLAVLSWVVLGMQTWHAFLATAPLGHAMLLNPDIWPKMASAFAAVRLLRGSEHLAWGVQAAAACAALACVILVCRRRPGAEAEVAVITSACMLCTPYVWDYDLLGLAVPLAWLASRAAADGWRAWEKSGAAAIYLLLGCVRMLNVGVGAPTAPVLVALLLWMAAARARAA